MSEAVAAAGLDCGRVGVHVLSNWYAIDHGALGHCQSHTCTCLCARSVCCNGRYIDANYPGHRRIWHDNGRYNGFYVVQTKLLLTDVPRPRKMRPVIVLVSDGGTLYVRHKVDLHALHHDTTFFPTVLPNEFFSIWQPNACN